MAELKTFLFTDICRSVDLKNEMIGRSVTERDVAFISQILTPHRERIEAHLEERGGRVVSTAGDGHFLVFDNTILAAQWAVDVQRSHRDDPIETPGGGQVEVRVSVHVGVPQVDPNDPDNFVGKSVDYASRLNDYATGAQILVSRSVMAILDDIGLEGISFHPHGRRHLKGIGQVEVHELMYENHDPRPLRKRPQGHSDREWTVIPTLGFEGSAPKGPGGSDLSLAAPAILKRVGNYELEEVLGSGGMGDVYKGRHTQFNRVRAIKVIKPQHVATGNKEMIRRFYQEIKAVGALEHKNIVVAIDSSTPEDRIHYLVMEYIEGVSLHELVDQQGHLSAPDACEIIRQAARGLQYIHRNGMVHRDIKPSNLMITLVDGDGTTSDPSIPHTAEGLQGVVKILDLGLALLNEDKHDRLTHYDNKAMGTGMYMSPEQWKTTSVDIRADIYSLGCTLYHLLSGNPPFYDSDLRPEKAHEKSSIPPIRTDGNIPRELWDVLQKMLAKKPEERYATPAEVVVELTPFVEGHDLVALVHGYVDPKTGGSTVRPTQVDSGARVDTWLSRASSMYPTRRWLLRRGLPLLLVGGAFLGLLWFMHVGKQSMIADAMQSEKSLLSIFAEDVSQNYVGKEITTRFHVLLEAASDHNMISMVKSFDPDQARMQRTDYPLEKWIKDQRRENMDKAPSNSWFINDRQGRQIARDPFIDDSGKIVSTFLDDFSFRDYFHGEKKDRSPEDAEAIEPITAPNISAVYESRNSGLLKVAFSVPIWSTATETGSRSVIGVLSTSFNLGAFEVSGLPHSKGKQIVLVDLRDDYLEVTARQGLILNHEHQSIWKKEVPPRVDPKVLAATESEED
ncbi:MAG: protein kinase, partial [Planctomycetes bacterium]|nr:protein kinase [Planctomycetota bacterium]